MSNYNERIAQFECVSEYTTDRCPKCIDCCKAFRWKVEVNDLLRDNNIDPIKNEEDAK